MVEVEMATDEEEEERKERIFQPSLH